MSTTNAQSGLATQGQAPQKIQIAMNRPGTAMTIMEVIQKRAASLNDVATKHMTSEKLIKIVASILSRNPKLAKCTPMSVLNCCMDAATLGLAPVLGRCHFVPFKNGTLSKEVGVDVYECQLIVGYQGFCDLMRRSGEIGPITADVVREGDKFRYRLGSDPTIEHEPLSVDGKLTHAYAIAHFTKGGQPQMVVMTAAQVEAVKRMSKGAYYMGKPKMDSPWHSKDFEPEMWKKTAVRRLAKLAPMAVEELQSAYEKAAAHPDFNFAGLREVVGEADVSGLPPADGDGPGEGGDGDDGGGKPVTDLADELTIQVKAAEGPMTGPPTADPKVEERRQQLIKDAEKSKDAGKKQKPCARGQVGCSKDDSDFQMIDGALYCAEHLPNLPKK